MSSVLDETSIRTSRPGLTQANGSRSLVRPLGRHGRRTDRQTDRQTERQIERHTKSETAAGNEDVSKRLMFVSERRACDVERCRECVAVRRSDVAVTSRGNCVRRERERALREQRFTGAVHCSDTTDYYYYYYFLNPHKKEGGTN